MTSKDLKLRQLRGKIDDIDQSIIKLLAERQKISQEIGKYKAARGLPIQQGEREAEIIKKHTQEAKNAGLAVAFIEKLFDIIFQYSRKDQQYTDSFDKKPEI